MNPTLHPSPPPLLPMPVGERQAVEGEDFEHFRQLIATSCPHLRKLTLPSGQRTLRHRLCAIPLGSLTVGAASTGAYVTSLAEIDALTVLVPTAGAFSVRVQGRDLHAVGGHAGLLLDGTALQGSSPGCAGLILHLERQQLTRTLAAMRGQETEAVKLPRSQELLLDPAQDHRLATHLELLLQQLEATLGSPSLGQLLGLDELLLRYVAVLSSPELLGVPARALPTKASRTAILALCERIVAMLPKNLTLTDLEIMSGLSSRSLQSAFRRYTGFSPLEWTRLQRLEWARRKLAEAGPDETVTSIALDAGFPHPGDFARRFAERYGESPSRFLLRMRDGHRLRH